MTFAKSLIAAGLIWILSAPASAHIDLLSPKPLLDGRAMNYRALKQAPFGAPGVDVAAAPATRAQSGGSIDLEVEVYIFHPGEIVVSWTRDFTGADVAPVMALDSPPGPDNPIPYANWLATEPVPDNTGMKANLSGSDDQQRMILNFSAPLPDVEGEILLVVRQIMTDKIDATDDGGVSLARVYYHQAAKLNLVK